MSGVSSAELLLLLVLGLIVLGPKRLPEIANKLGGWVGQARRMTRVMKRQLEEELNASEFNSILQPKSSSPKASPPVTGKPAASAAAPNPADPAYDDADYAPEVVADHVPHDDDSYSPLHKKDEE
jgi:sec-independent protein translocase protein TatB